MTHKRFDSEYFEKWYRHPDHRVGTVADLGRLVRFAITAAEYVLSRPVRSVLDVGAGEGRWQPILRKVRPNATYQGIDPSDYVVSRYGKRRNIVQGTLNDIPMLFPRHSFDLVVCCSVINYLPRNVMIDGIRKIAGCTAGLAYLEIFTSEDDVEGDTHGWYSEPRESYRRITRNAGLIPCGLHCYIPTENASTVVGLERA